MSKRVDLRSRFTIPGVFWNPHEPEDKFSGILSSDGSHIEFNTSAKLLKPETAADQFFGSKTRTPDFMHGFTTEGPCSLIGIHELLGPGLADFPNDRAIASRKFRINACLRGAYLESDTKPNINSAWFFYTGIDKWLPGIGSMEVTPEQYTVSYPKDSITLLDFSVCADHTRIWIKIHSNFEYQMGDRGCSARSEPIIGVEPPEPKSLDWFFDIGNRFENFFSLAMGTSVRLKAILLKTSLSDGWLVRPRPGKVQQPDVRVWVPCDAFQLAGGISAWFSERAQFRPVENLIYGTIRNSSLFVETEFLSLAQALESTHRISSQVTLLEPTVFAGVAQAIIEAIGKVCSGSLFDKLRRSVQLANEPDFKHRIESLMSVLQSDHAKQLLGDLEIFEQTLRQTRNYLTHPGIKKQSKVLTGAKDFFLFNQKLHAFLRILMLLRVGFTEDLVFDPVLRQARLFTVF